MTPECDAAARSHPLARRIQLIQGSSIDPEIIARVHAMTDRHQYLKTHLEFEFDKQIDHKPLISVAPDGYLRRVA